MSLSPIFRSLATSLGFSPKNAQATRLPFDASLFCAIDGGMEEVMQGLEEDMSTTWRMGPPLAKWLVTGVICLGTTPHPVTVTTRIKPSFVTVTGPGVDRIYAIYN